MAFMIKIYLCMKITRSRIYLHYNTLWEGETLLFQVLPFFSKLHGYLNF